MMQSLQRLVSEKLGIFLLIIFILRFGFIAASDFNLVGDESYYWDWSRDPDWCYFSKPPMVAWIIGATTWLLGDYTEVVRLPAVFLGTLFLYVLFQTTKAFYSRRVAVLVIFIILATPGNIIANIIMTIDPPLYFFWMVSLFYLHQALFQGRKSAWLLAGTATALAFLSKPLALALPLMLALFLLITPERRKLLINDYWLYLLPLLLSAIPLVFWNQQHDWIMLNHSQGHFGVKTREFSDVLGEFAVFVLFQALLLTPVIFVLVLKVCAVGLFRFRSLSEQEQFLYIMGPLLLVGIFGLSLLQKVQGNWPGPFYFSTLILLAGWITAGRWKKWLKPALVTGFVCVVLVYSLPLSSKVLGIENTQLDPTQRLRRWKPLVNEFEMVRRDIQDISEPAFILVQGHRYLVSELAFYLPDHPQVYKLQESGHIESQYDLWPGPEQFIGGDGIIVSRHPPDRFPGHIQKVFASFNYVETITSPTGKKRRYYIYHGKTLKLWPPG